MLFTLLLWQHLGMANEPFIFYYRISDKTEYHGYTNNLIKLALDKTQKEYGPYRMIALDPEENSLRAHSDVARNTYGNMALEQSYDPELDHTNLSFIPIPIDGGLMGYRVCFVNPAKKREIESITHIDQLKQFTIAQGVGWTDTKILKANGLKLVEIPNYPNIFKMLVANRVDLFCRGAHQIKPEIQYFSDLKNLDYNRSFLLVYDTPRFLYIHKLNTTAKARIQRGLEIAFKDGSMKKLWEKHYRDNLDFVNFDDRNIIHLENPYLKNLQKGYKDYYFNLKQKK